MFFSSIRFEAWHGKGVPRGNVLARFLVTSCRVTRSNIKRTARRVVARLSVEEVVKHPENQKQKGENKNE